MSADEFSYVDTLTVAEEGMRIAEPSRSGYSFEPVSQRVLGAAIEVHKCLGPGFREELYLNARCIELDKRGLRFRRKAEFPVFYEGRQVGVHELDLLVEESVVVELKAISSLAEVHFAQVTAYPRATNLRIGLLLNFGEMPLGIKRIVNDYKTWPTSRSAR